MKREEISDALDFLDDDMIHHTDLVRNRRNQERKVTEKDCTAKNRNFYGKRSKLLKWYIVAACLCLFCFTAFFYRSTLRTEMRDDSVEEMQTISDEQDKPDMQGIKETQEENFVQISDLLVRGNNGFIEEACEQLASIPIGRYDGIYTKVSSVDSAILSECIGTAIPSAEETFCVSGHSDLQYLIRNDHEGYSLWKFQSFDSSEYPYSDVLKLVYRIDSPEMFTQIVVKPATMDNTDGGIKIQEEIGTRQITERNEIEAIYEVLSAMTCYGSGRWDLVDYGDAEAAVDVENSHEAVRLGRYLSIATDYGNEIDGLKYTAVSNMFYEYSGIAYSRLSQAQAKRVSEILGIGEFGQESTSDGLTGTDETQQPENQSDTMEEPEEVNNFEQIDTGLTLEYVTKLQEEISEAMMNHELPFVTSSSVYENPYRLHIVVTSDAEKDIEKLRSFDSSGGALEIEYSTVNINKLEMEKY